MLAGLLALLAAAAVLAQLFVGADVGMADNGDGFRLMCELQLFKSDEVLFDRLVVRYDDVPYGCDEELRYFSSQQWLTAAAQDAFQLRYGTDMGFDLRAGGVVHAGVFGLAMGLLHLALPGPRLQRVVTVVTASVLLADISFVAYFVSAFSEPATFLGLLLVTAAAAWYVRTVRWPVAALVALTAAGLFLALAKSQTFPFALLLAPVLLLRPVPVGGRAGRWTGRIAPSAAAAVLIGASVGNLLQQPEFFARVNLHNIVFETLLTDAEDPAQVLTDLGLPTGLVRYEGQGYFEPEAAGKDADPEYQEFVQQVGRADVVVYLGRHPQQSLRMLREGSLATAVMRPHYLSNYTTARAPEDYLAPRPAPTQRVLSAPGRSFWPLLPLVWVGVAVAGAVVAVRTATSRDRRTTAVLCYLLAAGALSQVVVALVGDGYYELVKHTVLAAYASALLLAVAAGAGVQLAVNRLAARRSGARGAADPGAPAAP